MLVLQRLYSTENATVQLVNNKLKAVNRNFTFEEYYFWQRLLTTQIMVS